MVQDCLENIIGTYGINMHKIMDTIFRSILNEFQDKEVVNKPEVMEVLNQYFSNPETIDYMYGRLQSQLVINVE